MLRVRPVGGWRARLLRFAWKTRMPLREANRVAVYGDSGDILAAARELIRGATRTLDVEMYIWRNDETGQGFMALLAEAASRGVAVRAVYDAVGSWTTTFETLHAAGVQVVPYHPLNWRFRRKMNRRNHRKLLVVDDSVAIVGSHNFADEYDTRAFPDGYRDVGIGVVGPAVEDLARDFRRLWRRTTGGSLPDPQAARGDLLPPGELLDEVTVQIVSGLKRGERNAIRRLYFLLMGRASRSVVIGNSYFVPGRRLLRSLTSAARRGVEVRLVVPGVTDQSFLQLAARSTYGALLSAGVRIFERERRVLHSKVAVIDEEIAVIGSANLDTRSVRHNLELNVEMHDRRIAARLRAIVERDLAESREVALEEVRTRPLLVRLLERLAYLFRYWL